MRIDGLKTEMKNIELDAWQRVAGLAQSPSHDFHHIERVQAYVDALGEKLGIDITLVRLAAILHDLGRSDENRRHGLSSIEASKEMAEEVLRHLPLSDQDRTSVVEAIEGHDQPDLRSKAEAVRILKDADFLAGFGAWGVLRIAMWSGETGRRVEDVIQRLSTGMKRRFEALEYADSRQLAAHEYIFARQFLAELDRPIRENLLSPGCYCIIEGISGVGKNTLALELLRRLQALNLPCRVIEEPSATFRNLRSELPEGSTPDFVPLKKALFMADRADQFSRVITPALQNGEIVIGVRSYLSTAVYQSEAHADAYRIILEHDWVPRCDLLLLLEVDAEEALTRAQSRGKSPGDFETAEHLTAHKAKYRELASVFPCGCLEIINTSHAAGDVAEKAFQALARILKFG